MLDHITAIEKFAMQLERQSYQPASPRSSLKFCAPYPKVRGESKKTVSLVTARLIKGKSRLQKSVRGDPKPEAALYKKEWPYS